MSIRIMSVDFVANLVNFYDKAKPIYKVCYKLSYGAFLSFNSNDHLGNLEWLAIEDDFLQN